MFFGFATAIVYYVCNQHSYDHYCKCEPCSLCVRLFLSGAPVLIAQHALTLAAWITIVIFNFSSWVASGSGRAVVNWTAPSRAICVFLALLDAIHEGRALVSVFIAAARETFELIITYIIDFFHSILASCTDHTLVVWATPTWHIAIIVILARLPQVVI